MFTITLNLDESELNAIGHQAEALIGPACATGLARGIDAGVAEAKANHKHQDRTGELTGSVGGAVLFTASDGAAGVFEASANHASFIERGTDAHEIRPKKAGALHWINEGGNDVFLGRVYHPGTSPLPFMEPAADKIREVSAEEIKRDLTARLEALLGG